VIVLAILVALTSAAGIGGGVILVPAIKIFFEFSQSDTVPLAQMCVFVSALTRFIQVYSDKHPLKPKAVPTDYTIGMVLLPTVMIGSSAGVMGHVIIPDVICTIMLEILLLYTAYKTFLNGRKSMAKENAARLEAKRKQEEELSREEE